MNRARKQQVPHPITDIERRASSRYATNLEIHYSTLGEPTPVTMGTGRTIDLSSAGLSFTTATPLLVGQRIKAYIDWPAMLNGNVKLQLEVWGVVVRTDEKNAAIRIEGHDFKTRSARQRSA